jgi:hypothetical protein
MREGVEGQWRGRGGAVEGRRRGSGGLMIYAHVTHYVYMHESLCMLLVSITHNIH